jgi:hypothetical protein
MEFPIPLIYALAGVVVWIVARQVLTDFRTRREERVQEELSALIESGDALLRSETCLNAGAYTNWGDAASEFVKQSFPGQLAEQFSAAVTELIVAHEILDYSGRRAGTDDREFEASLKESLREGVAWLRQQRRRPLASLRARRS